MKQLRIAETENMLMLLSSFDGGVDKEISWVLLSVSKFTKSSYL